MPSGARRPRRPPGEPIHRLRPVVWATFGVLATYAALQVLAGRTMTSTLWWKNEWLRIKLAHKYPKSSFAHAVPGPGWQTWLPSAATSFVLVLALVLLALLMVRANRGWWLLVVAAVPLIPAQIAPGTWAPELSNQVMYAMVWPAGATTPVTAWSWVSAAVEALVIAVPALALRSVVHERSPRVHSSDLLRRLVLPCLVVVAVVSWNISAGEAQDWGMLGRRLAFGAIGAALATGSVRLRWALPALVVLPLVAGGFVRWTTGVDGQPLVVTDAAAWALPVCALCGAAWVLAQPYLARAFGVARMYWTSMLEDYLATPEDRAEDEAEVEADGGAGNADGVEAAVNAWSPAASASGGGRHRG